ncbi:MAG: alpha-keto acid decarboxylase family protein [Halobacteriota archaeon]
MPVGSQNVGEYLIERLASLGLQHVFGVPGDYVLGFFKQLSDSPLNLVTTCDELSAGYAADAYARIRGIGAVCITYCVGGLKVVNAAAQAYAEKSPLAIIAGAPGVKERVGNPLLHHKVRTFETQKRVFEEVTVASTVLDNSQTACQEIDRVFSNALKFKRPVYIELPRDVTFAPIQPSRRAVALEEDASNPHTLQSALEEAVTMINAARQPVVIAGVEIHRFGLIDNLLALIDKTHLPVAATILSKSVVGEFHPGYIGIYEGAMGFPQVREYVESSDCLLLLGAPLTDVDLGQYTAHIDQEKTIYVTSEQCSIRYHSYANVRLHDFLAGLINADITPRTPSSNLPRPASIEPFSVVKGHRITVRRLFERLNWALDDSTVVIADVGDALFGGLDLITHRRIEFLSPAYYLSLGFAVPASIGAQLADPQRRPLVLVGDGAFQMTGLEVSTIARLGLDPIVIVLNNHGYATERPIQDGPFNDLQLWQYSLLPQIVGGGRGAIVRTEDELDIALEAARVYREGFTIIDVQLGPHDSSPALQRLTESLAKKVR